MKLCSGAAFSEFPRCSATPRSTRCTKHSCVPCGPATHCPCQPHNKRHRPLPSPEHQPAPIPPNITQSHTLPSPLVTIPEHTQLEDTETCAVLPSPPRPPNECPPPAPRAPSNRNSRPKNALLATEMSPPPPAKRQCPRPEPPTRSVCSGLIS